MEKTKEHTTTRKSEWTKGKKIRPIHIEKIRELAEQNKIEEDYLRLAENGLVNVEAEFDTEGNMVSVTFRAGSDGNVLLYKNYEALEKSAEIPIE